MVKYTEDVLHQAVSASTSMSGVLRQLEVPLNGGSHAHLRRRILELGIDTSHFTGQAGHRGRPSQNRRTAAEVLVLRDPTRHRAKPRQLRRAMIDSGVAYRCAHCEIASVWCGAPLILHVDHVNGDFADCRLENLRFLCPNCHSQSETYAGRNRRIYTPHRRPSPPAAGDIPEIMRRVAAGDLGATEAARLIGCSRGHVYRLKAQLLNPPVKRFKPSHAAILECALSHPDEGARKIATRLARSMVDVSHGTVSNVLRRAGLHRREYRRQAAEARRIPQGAATV